MGKSHMDYWVWGNWRCRTVKRPMCQWQGGGGKRHIFFTFLTEVTTTFLSACQLVSLRSVQLQSLQHFAFCNLKKLHANSAEDGLENVKRRFRWQWDICDVCRDIIPLSPARCCVKKEFAGLMQFALSFFAVSKKDLIQPPSNYKECEPATQ